jgi:hypothetical protein
VDIEVRTSSYDVFEKSDFMDLGDSWAFLLFVGVKATITSETSEGDRRMKMPWLGHVVMAFRPFMINSS